MKKDLLLFDSKMICLLLSCILLFSYSYGQKAEQDTTKTNIIILNNDYGEYLQSNGNSVHKLINNVKLLHDSDTLYCDSAFFYQSLNSVEAFGDVAIFQADGTQAFADYMRYTGNDKRVFMRGIESDAQLSDNKGNNLWSKEITYDLNTKMGQYNRGGTLQSDATIVSSLTGIYNLKTKDARFKKNVEVNDPKYHVVSDDLGYNTNTKIVRFFGSSVVTNDKSILQTSNGVYDTKDKSAHFVNRSSILNEGQYIEADTLDYDRQTGFGIAIGNVIAIDTAQNSTLYCDYAQYNEITGTLLTYGNPLMRILKDKDSLFIKADTFFSTPIVIKDTVLNAQDSLQNTADQIQASVIENDTSLILNKDSLNENSISFNSDSINTFVQNETHQSNDSLILFSQINSKKDKSIHAESDTLIATSVQGSNINSLNSNVPLDSLQTNDTIELPLTLKTQQILDSTTSTYHNQPEKADTNKPRYFIGYNHVLIFSDSLQGKCDSISYSQNDSLMRMFQNPVLWPAGSQISGDKIFIQLFEGKIKELYVPHNAIIISQSGPEKAKMFDQIQGNTLRAYFTNNNLDSLFAQPNAASIYYVKDDDSAYVGSSQSTSEQIEIIFDSGKIQRIYYRQDVQQTLTPMKSVHPSTLHLSRFNWRESERPKSLKIFLDGVSLPHQPELFKK